MMKIEFLIFRYDMIHFCAFFPAHIQVMFLLSKEHEINCIGLNLNVIKRPDNDSVFDWLFKHDLVVIIKGFKLKVDIFIMLDL